MSPKVSVKVSKAEGSQHSMADMTSQCRFLSGFSSSTIYVAITRERHKPVNTLSFLKLQKVALVKSLGSVLSVCFPCFQDQPQVDLENKFVLFNGYLLFFLPSWFFLCSRRQSQGVNECSLSLVPEKC